MRQQAPTHNCAPHRGRQHVTAPSSWHAQPSAAHPQRTRVCLGTAGGPWPAGVGCGRLCRTRACPGGGAPGRDGRTGPCPPVTGSRGRHTQVPTAAGRHRDSLRWRRPGGRTHLCCFMRVHSPPSWGSRLYMYKYPSAAPTSNRGIFWILVGTEGSRDPGHGFHRLLCGRAASSLARPGNPPPHRASANSGSRALPAECTEITPSGDPWPQHQAH